MTKTALIKIAFGGYVYNFRELVFYLHDREHGGNKSGPGTAVESYILFFFT